MAPAGFIERRATARAAVVRRTGIAGFMSTTIPATDDESVNGA